MKVTLNRVRETRKQVDAVDFIVLGIVSKCSAAFLGTPIVLRNEYDLKTYLYENSKEFEEIKKILDIGVTVVINNSIEDKDEFHSWLTPIKDNLVIPSKFNNSLEPEPGHELTFKSPADFDGETYVINIRYDPSMTPSENDFFINLPSGFTNSRLDSEFVSSVTFHTGPMPEYADSVNDVYEVIIPNVGNLGDIFDYIQGYFTINGTQNDYITPYILKDAVNDKVNGVFTIYYKLPLKYLPKTIHPSSLDISYSYYENIQLLSDYLPRNTVTFESKLIGDCSNLTVSYSDGLLTISLDDQVEEFEVSTDWNSGDFIGNIRSNLVNVTVNGEFGDEIKLPEFSEQFHPVANLLEANIDLNKSVDNLIESDYQVNLIILSDTLCEYDLQDFDTSKLDREVVIAYKESDISQLKLDYINTLKFAGLVGSIPSYIPFIDSLYTCRFTVELDDIPRTSKESNWSVYNIWNPKLGISCNYLDSFELSEFVRSGGLPLDKITIYHLFYIMALSKFILRYKSDLLFALPSITISRLNLLINKFSDKFSIFRKIDLTESDIEGNKVTVNLSTYLNSILKYKEVFLNFNLEF